MKITPFFKWFDLWIGVYIDTVNKTVYICPIPTLGIKIQFSCKHDFEFGGMSGDGEVYECTKCDAVYYGTYTS